MPRKKSLDSILLITTSFVSGVAAGMLLTPKNGLRNRLWISDRAHQVSKWIKVQQQSVQNKGKSELSKLRNNVQQGIRQNVPDLYDATKHIDLNARNINSG